MTDRLSGYPSAAGLWARRIRGLLSSSIPFGVPAAPCGKASSKGRGPSGLPSRRSRVVGAAGLQGPGIPRGQVPAFVHLLAWPGGCNGWGRRPDVDGSPSPPAVARAFFQFCLLSSRSSLGGSPRPGSRTPAPPLARPALLGTRALSLGPADSWAQERGMSGELRESSGPGAPPWSCSASPLSTPPGGRTQAKGRRADIRVPAPRVPPSVHQGHPLPSRSPPTGHPGPPKGDLSRARDGHPSPKAPGEGLRGA